MATDAVELPKHSAQPNAEEDTYWLLAAVLAGQTLWMPTVTVVYSNSLHIVS